MLSVTDIMRLRFRECLLNVIFEASWVPQELVSQSFSWLLTTYNDTWLEQLGKSTFINLVTGDDKIVVGHGTESKTEFVDASCFLDPDTHLSTMIVDTPGFDDSQRSDVDVLKTITEFIVNSVGGRKLNGIIYMHRISDPRTGGVAKKNLRMFKELCGEKTLAKVVIVTTNWSRVGKEEGDDRENELRKGFFKPLLEEGACMFRHDNSVKGALTILSHLLHEKGTAIKVAKELHTKIAEELHEGKELVDTSAGAVLSADIKAMEARHKEEMLELKRDMEKANRAKDAELKLELEQEHRELDISPFLNI
ncbi:uncharacterized protein LACBIDRAFT_321404 [Laccaria bicolor S238N-H82]|uniref:Predicted protein n=1 Tax=Laccaria bicolor (strain S238N-H82 / ATCC MYA-4686) TaxID=486041 RepID=B0CQ92_LACBS|nr:uncharacterized protein LACBIDRAFT_321404 [Laccaria bicolor S238N-H82]EDR15514.1 predicted protein [Laccaria bicolor S238N-H82]|eukprot:XP_001873722.1 predicted protein [Laccaria bicolor S238N-H82]